jgi:tRNA-specific 2-thiouridylase
MKTFLKNYLPNKQGNIIEIDTGENLGKHIGLMYYTIGQRRGLDVGGTKRRLYVVGKDLNKNILYVAEGDDNPYLYSDSCIIDTVNFNCDERPTKCTAKFRYRATDYPVTLEYLENGEIKVKYDNIKSVTPGQACVFYDGEKCLGGGIIKTVCKNNEKCWWIL